MAEKDYSSQDVIEALAAEDFTEEQIRILVPILGYESRVGVNHLFYLLKTVNLHHMDSDKQMLKLWNLLYGWQ
mgnify:CR=1 FL=1